MCRNRRSEWDALSGRASGGKHVPEFGSRVGCAFRFVPQRKLRPGIDAQNGTHFPGLPSNGNCVPECAPGTGCTFRIGPQEETVSQNSAPKRDALSETALKRKLHPGIRLQNGMPFPVEPLAENSSRNRCSGWDALSAMEPQAETMSQNSVSEWDALSASRLFGKCVPVWASELGHGFRGCCLWEIASQFGRQAGISSAASTTQHR